MSKTVAFIPLRGGSKSIPNKNIKLFCGKPLVYWSLRAAQCCSFIDEIILATDSALIEQVVTKFGFSKVTIYRRDPVNARDNSSTESVMLEYITSKDVPEDSIFLLIQATSPLIVSEDIERGVKLLSKYDSILSCVRQLRFYWEETGIPVNYDFKNRPRRQDFNGIMMENGALYGSTVSQIRESKNRISGSIGILEMPSYTSVELDEPDDWVIAESLMRLKRLNLIENSRKIRLFVSDVDGVLTDAGMYYSESGDELKKFNTHDGMAFQLLREKGVKTAIVTSEDTNIVENRAKKLKVDFFYQGRKNQGKLDVVMEICEKENIELSEVAYIGDDINCYELLTKVGVAACPFNAVNKIKAIPGIHQLSKNGGEGVVREFYEEVLGNYL